MSLVMDAKDTPKGRRTLWGVTRNRGAFFRRPLTPSVARHAQDIRQRDSRRLPPAVSTEPNSLMCDLTKISRPRELTPDTATFISVELDWRHPIKNSAQAFGNWRRSTAASPA